VLEVELDIVLVCFRLKFLKSDAELLDKFANFLGRKLAMGLVKLQFLD